MSDIVIKAENLGKKYIIGHQAENGRYQALRDVLMHNAQTLWNKTKDLAKGNPLIHGDTLEEVWALKDVSFEIRRGEAVGIIGRNGAGKSTLLKILSRITDPSAGRVTIDGRVASLLEVGTGFHPELSGRENIYLNGTILGMSRKEINQKFDEIVDFAGIEKYLDTPVKRYSSGMYVRLAFAVAAHLEPEILVVDEVLAVGDAEFQKKCLGKMGDVTKEGRTVLFVSHNMVALSALCFRSINLDSGKIIYNGHVDTGVLIYMNGLSNIDNPISYKTRSATGTGEMKIINSFLLRNGKPTLSNVACGDKVDICIEFECCTEKPRFHFALDIYNSKGNRIAYCNSLYTMGVSWVQLPKIFLAKCSFPKLPFFPDEYRVDISIHCNDERADYLQGALSLKVYEGDFYGSGKIPPISGASPIMLLEHKWTIDN